MGPGLLVAVGYMDPGNWATDLAAGSQFGFSHLFVVLMSNAMAILLQYLALKLGIATGRDLAQQCREQYGRRWANVLLWILAEVAIIAIDLAEIIGSAIALYLLVGIPKWLGVLFTALDVFVILLVQQKSVRIFEAIVGILVLVIGVIFAFELSTIDTPAETIFRGYLPSTVLVSDSDALYIAIGIIGATVMPHNLYLHSSIVQSRAFDTAPESRKRAVRYSTFDSTVSLMFAFFVNSAILILSACAFFHDPQDPAFELTSLPVTEIEDAYILLSHTVGNSAASILFAVALLAAGQNATLTGTLAGQIVMEGFVDLRIKSWLRRLITRLLAIVPAAVVAIFFESYFTKLLVLSQVLLSIQLPFAAIPLVLFTSSKSTMGTFANSWPLAVIAWIISLIIVGLNVLLLVDLFI